MSILLVVIASVYFIEDRYTKKSEAAELFVKACKEDAVIVAKLKKDMSESEQIIVDQLQQFSHKQDKRYLDELYRRKILYKRLIENSPDDETLREEYEIILDDIKAMREQIYKNESNP